MSDLYTIENYIYKIEYGIPGAELGAERSEVDDTGGGINVKTVEELEGLSVNTVCDLCGHTSGGMDNVKTQWSISDVKVTCLWVEGYPRRSATFLGQCGSKYSFAPRRSSIVSTNQLKFKSENIF